MIINNPPIKPTCPECGSQEVKTRLTPNTIMSWIGAVLGVGTIKIYSKRCGNCGHEFEVYRK